MTKKIVVVSAGTSDPSSTRMLADRVAQRAARLADDRGMPLAVTVVDLREIAVEVTTALVSQHIGSGLRAAIDAVLEADAIVASTPVYKAGPSGLFLSFFQLLDNDALIGKPVVLAATAGTARHALVADDQMRGMFGFFRAMTVPTALFAAPKDWADPGLSTRIDRAATELLALVESGVAEAIRGGSWTRYRHEFGTAGESAVDFDSDLMRLAAGGSAPTTR